MTAQQQQQQQQEQQQQQAAAAQAQHQTGDAVAASSSSSELGAWLTLAGIAHAEPLLAASGIERTADLAVLTAADVDALDLPGGIGPRLKWALRMPVEESDAGLQQQQSQPEELPPSITAGVGQLVSAELGGPPPAANPTPSSAQSGPSPRFSTVTFTVQQPPPPSRSDSSFADADGPPAFLASESSDGDVLASMLRRSQMGQSFIEEGDEVED